MDVQVAGRMRGWVVLPPHAPPAAPTPHALPPPLPPPPRPVGVGVFGMKSSNKVTSKLAHPSAPWGYSLCLVNLVLDGYTNAAQDEIHKRYHHGSALQVLWGRAGGLGGWRAGGVGRRVAGGRGGGVGEAGADPISPAPPSHPPPVPSHPPSRTPACLPAR